MHTPRVLIVLNSSEAWSRGILRGFMSVARARGWELLHYHASADLDWLASEWTPAAVVLGPELDPTTLRTRHTCPIVSVNADRSAVGVASACLDEARIGVLAARHLRASGLVNVTTFRFDDAPFSVAREQAFSAESARLSARVAEGWWLDGANPPRTQENSAALVAWLRALPKPCGVFTCADAWGRVVARYARAAGLRIPEDLALVGVDNDVVECELIAPPLSSVAVPWRTLGEKAASLVQQALAGKAIAGKRVEVSPIDVVARRSSSALAIEDALVAEAVSWVRAHADRRLSVPMVARAVGCSRQRLERRFRTLLGRSVQEEIRRAHVEAAKHALVSAHENLHEIARQSGFTSAALLSVAFQRELGMPPGVYRRRMQQALLPSED